MKKLSALLLLGAVCVPSWARQLTPEQALQRVQGEQSSALAVRSSVSTVTLAFEVAPVAAPSTPAVYVFDTKPGYLIVSANDCAMPLLGYSSSGSLGDEAIAPALKYWLQFYADQIEWAEKNGLSAPSSRISRATSMEAIEPMLKSTWNQSEPYNDNCPEFDGQRSVTGCVATALSQEMYYYQWPAKAQGGTLSYTSEYSQEYETNISLNFDNVTFDWDNMLPTYTTGNYTTDQADAVATLMYAAGVAVQMDYSPDESGASTAWLAPALYKYFGYSPAAVMPFRVYYTTTEWEDLVYGQLAANRPVLYGGDSTEGGHQFICDGYDGDGYFHFNWGWAGQSDGYYLLSALDPESQGIGGSTSGFNFNQSVCINVATPSQLPDQQYLIGCSGDFLTQGLYESMEEGGSSQNVTAGQQLQLMSSGYFGNYGCMALTGQFGILLTPSSGEATAVYASSASLPELVNGTVSGYTVTLPSNLADGTYSVTPIYLPQGADSYVDVLTPVAGIRSLTLELTDGSGTITVGEAPEFSITSAQFKSEVYSGSFFSLEFTAQNEGSSEYYGTIGAVLLQDDEEIASTSQVVPVTLEAGAQGTFNLIAMFETENGETVPAGTYQVLLLETTTDNTVGPSNTLTVNVKEALTADPELNVTLSIEGGNDVTDASAITFKGTVTCESGYLANQLMLFIFPDEADADDIYYTYTDYMFLGEGQQQEFTLNVNLSNVVKEGETYLAALYTSSEQALGGNLTFTVATSSIEEIFGDNPAAAIDVYDLGGRAVMLRATPDEIGALSPGIYIFRQGTQSRKVLVK